MFKRWTDFIIALHWSAVGFSVEAAGQMTDRKLRFSELRGLLTMIKDSVHHCRLPLWSDKRRKVSKFELQRQSETFRVWRGVRHESAVN